MAHSIPFITVWTDDVLVKIMETGEPTLATGARMRLWCFARRRDGRLPKDENQLAAWAGVSAEEWISIRDFLVSSWEQGETEYIIPRIVEQCKYIEDAKLSGKRGAEKRWAEKGPHRDPIDPPSKPQWPPTPTPTPTPTPLKAETPPRPVWDETKLRSLTARIGRQRPKDTHSLDLLLMRAHGEGVPWEAVDRALRNVLKAIESDKLKTSADRYVAKVLKIEGPNAHAREAEAQGVKIDKREAASLLGQIGRRMT